MNGSSLFSGTISKRVWHEFDILEPFATLERLPGSESLRVGNLIMRRVAEYEVRAEECRRLAANMRDPEQKKQLEEVARAWHRLARARLDHLRNGWDEPPAPK
jgi:hypothetical protein